MAELEAEVQDWLNQAAAAEDAEHGADRRGDDIVSSWSNRVLQPAHVEVGDYTVNCASGFPAATGATRDPINHVLPAWDVAAGLYLTLGVLTDEHVRHQTGLGQEMVLSLADVMLATVGNLGCIGDVQVSGAVRKPIGNHLYGAFGRDFATRDGRRIMLVAISNRQWRANGRTTGLAAKLDIIGMLMDVDMTMKAPL